MVAILWLGFSRGSLELEFFLHVRSWWIDGILGLLAAFLLVGLWTLGKKYVEDLRGLERLLEQQLGALDSDTVISLAIISGFAEELFFRGAVQNSFGWLVSTLLFAIVHSGPHRVFRAWVLFAFIAGLVFSGLTFFRGNLLAAIVAHITVNGINLWRLTRPGQEIGNVTE